MHPGNTLKKNVSAATLLLVFLFYFSGTHLFVHTHDTGELKYTHSHPYRGEASSPQHGHNGVQAQTIAHLDNWTGEQACSSFLPPSGLWISNLNPPHILLRYFSFSSFFCGRAPPSFLSFSSSF